MTRTASTGEVRRSGGRGGVPVLGLLAVCLLFSLSVPLLLSSFVRRGSSPSLDVPILAGLETFRSGEGGNGAAVAGRYSDRALSSSPLDPTKGASSDAPPEEKEKAAFPRRSGANAAPDVPTRTPLSHNRQKRQQEPPSPPRRQKKRQLQPRGRVRRRWAPRFPKFGTDSFEWRCSWATDFARRAARRRAGTDCSFLVRPEAASNEGIAKWTSEVAIGMVTAQQVGCRLYADYGPGVDVGRVLVSPVMYPSSSSPAGDEYNNNWTVPEGYRCGMKDWCFNRPYSEEDLRVFLGYLKDTLLPPPEYRFIYTRKIEPGQFDELERTALPGFDAEEGMACAIGSLFELAPSAAEFVPHLFTEIMPALKDDADTFVLALYVRTGNTDKMATMEEKGNEVKQQQWTKLSKFDDRIVQCALQLERERLSPEYEVENDEEWGEGGSSYRGKPPSRITWMVITDSPSVGKVIVSEHDGQEIIVEGEGGSATNTSITRRVLTTGARGVQTRKERNPSTVDFAEAVIDWYLLGESNAVILSSTLSFGATGAMRKARPLYRVGDGCRPTSMIREEKATA